MTDANHDPLRPTAGARFALVRRDATEPGDRARDAVYDARIVTPDAVHELVVDIRAGTDVSVTLEAVDDASAPRWATDHLRAIARGMGRSAMRGDAWPRRLLRWRAAKP